MLESCLMFLSFIQLPRVQLRYYSIDWTTVARAKQPTSFLTSANPTSTICIAHAGFDFELWHRQNESPDFFSFWRVRELHGQLCWLDRLSHPDFSIYRRKTQPCMQGNSYKIRPIKTCQVCHKRSVLPFSRTGRICLATRRVYLRNGNSTSHLCPWWPPHTTWLRQLGNRIEKL